MTLTDEQVSMLLSEAEAGWPRGYCRVWALVMGLEPDAFDNTLSPSVLHDAWMDPRWLFFDSHNGLDAAGRLLAVLIRHGLVRCGACDGKRVTVHRRRGGPTARTCRSCHGTGKVGAR